MPNFDARLDCLPSSEPPYRARVAPSTALDKGAVRGLVVLQGACPRVLNGFAQVVAQNSLLGRRL